MCSRKLFLLCSMLVFVSCANKNRKESRGARILTFNTTNDDVTVSLEFSIPFLTIPVKKTMDSTFGLSLLGLPTINLNVAALALGGVVVLGTSVLLPLLLKNYAMKQPYQRYAKLLDTTEFGAGPVLDFANQMLSDSRGFHACTLRIACWSGRREYKSDYTKIWKQILSNSLLTSMINSTAIEEATLSGRGGRDCSAYTPCPLREEHVSILMNNLAALSKSNG